MQVSALDFLTTGATPGNPSAGRVELFGGKTSNGHNELFTHSSTGRDRTLQNSLSRSRIAMATANGDTTVVSQIGMNLSATGTLTIAPVSSASFYRSQKRVDILAAASTSAVAGFYSASNQFYRGDAAGRGGFNFACRWMPTTGQAATTRGFCGFTSGTSAPTDVDPSTLADVLGMGWDTADSSIQIMHRTGSGTVVKDSLSSITFPIPSADTTVFDFEMYCPPNGSVIYWKLSNLTTGLSIAGSFSADIPASTTFLSPRCYMSVAGVNSVIGVSFLNLYIETDF